MADRWLKMARTAQTWFPWAADAKYEAQRLARRVARRPFEDDFRALRLLDLGGSPLLVDAGANRGQSIDAFRLMVPGARILAFEPNPRLAERLRRRYRGLGGVGIEAVGLGDRPGRLELKLPSYNGYPFDGLASFDEASVQDWLAPRIFGYDPTRLRVDRFTCPVRTLDDFGVDPAVVKIDVQGFERQVIAGARETLRRAGPALLVEGPDAATIADLGALGYRPYAYRDGRLVVGQTGKLNTYFLAEGSRVAVRAGAARPTAGAPQRGGGEETAR